jgi:hypothetical protein
VLFLFSISYSQNHLSVVQKGKEKFEISLKINSAPANDEDIQQSIAVKNTQTRQTQIINNIETSVTGKPSRLEANDYNFDGYTDFATFHTDDGMGVYTIYQIFIFNPKTKKFNALEFPTNYNSKCDMFCDVKIDKIKKTLHSSCRGGAKTHTDIWKYDQHKKLTLLKTESN